MALPSEFKELGGYAIKGGVLVLGYVMARNGAFGQGLQTFATQLGMAVTQTASGASLGNPIPPTTTTTAGGGNNAAGTGPPAGAPPSSMSHQGGQTSDALTRMIAGNPNFVSQATQWRQLRGGCCGAQFVGDPNDWTAFRNYQMGIGAPDPGPNPPAEWPSYFGGVMGPPQSNTRLN